jgi:hypothetical protein
MSAQVVDMFSERAGVSCVVDQRPSSAAGATLPLLGSHRGRSGASAQSGRDHRRSGAENRIGGEND